MDTASRAKRTARRAMRGSGPSDEPLKVRGGVEAVLGKGLGAVIRDQGTNRSEKEQFNTAVLLGNVSLIL